VCAEGVFDLGDLYFETVGDETAIESRVVTALTQDQEGYLWIGTQAGLTRYDGYRFRRFRHDKDNPNSLAGDYVRSLWMAPDGKLWIGMQSDGVSVFDPSTDRFENYRHDPGDPNSLAHNRVDAIVGDGLGGVWLGTDNGLDHLDPSSERFTHFRQDDDDTKAIQNNHIRSLLLDDKSDLWVGSRSGLDRRRNGRTGFENLSKDENAEDTLVDREVVCLFQDTHRRVWIGTRQHGAAWIDPSNLQLHWIPLARSFRDGLAHPFVLSIAQINPNEIWLGTRGGGVTVVEASTGFVQRQIQHDAAISSSINLNQIGALWVGEDDLVWVGTWGGGLNRFSPSNKAFRTLRHSQTRSQTLSHANVLSVHELTSGQIWIGTGGNGIDILDPVRGVIGGFRSDPELSGTLADGTVKAIAELSGGRVFVGTLAGLHRFQPEFQTFQHFTREDGLLDDYVRSLLAAPDGILWVGTNAGLNRFDPSSSRFERFNDAERQGLLFEEDVHALAQTSNGVLWVGTGNGLYVLPPGEQALRRITHDPDRDDSLSHDFIVGLLVDRQDRLWVATGEGLYRLDSRDGQMAHFELISSSHEWHGENLLEDAAGRIWSEVSMIDPTSWRVQEFGRADAVDIGTPWIGSFTQTRDGTLLYGGSKGLLMVRPERLGGWIYEPPVHISEVLVDGVRLPGTRLTELELAPEKRSFSLEFTALDYSAPDKLQYAYRLVGYDPDWINTDAENRRATYTNLDPGTYTFQVRATNRVGTWSPHELSILIRRLPYWYQTNIFRTLIAVTLVLLPFLLYKVRMQQLRASKRRLQSEVEARTRSIGVLSVIGREITESLRLNEVIGTVYARVHELFKADAFSIGVYHQETETIEFPMTMEKGSVLPSTSYRMGESDRLAVWCVRYGQEVHTQTLADGLKYVSTVLEPVDGEEMESVLFLPLRVTGETVGCMTVQRQAPGGFDDVQLDMLRTIGANAAIAIDHALAHAALKKASLTDPLTQLPNRRAFIELSQHQISVAAGNGTPLSFVMADIDKFKNFNDEYGHDGGDYVLKEVASLFRKLLREQDVVARWGGEEFVFMLPNTALDEAKLAIDKIRVALTEKHYLFNDHHLGVTSTFGIVAYNHVKDLDAALKAADEALYLGKENGRNQVVLATVPI